MLRFDTILVPVDFEPESLAAVRHACSLAGDASVKLLHVVNSEAVPRYAFIGRDLVDELVEQRVREAEDAIGELARDLKGNGSKITTEVRRGRPADEIVSAAHSASMVVMGAHAKGLIEQVALGSVAEEVARRSPAAVLIVRGGAEGSTKVRRILLALDVADPSLEAIESASELANRTGAPLEVVHAIPWPVPIGRPKLNPTGIEGDLSAQVREGAERELRSLVSKTVGQSAKIHVVMGNPAHEIARYARPDDIIVSGTHARGTIGRLAFGTVATALARRAPCPVLLVRKLSA